MKEEREELRRQVTKRIAENQPLAVSMGARIRFAEELLAALDELDAKDAELATAHQRNAEVKKLHGVRYASSGEAYCDCCGGDWPCATLRALAGGGS